MSWGFEKFAILKLNFGYFDYFFINKEILFEWNFIQFKIHFCIIIGVNSKENCGVKVEIMTFWTACKWATHSRYVSVKVFFTQLARERCAVATRWKSLSSEDTDDSEHIRFFTDSLYEIIYTFSFPLIIFLFSLSFSTDGVTGTAIIICI